MSLTGKWSFREEFSFGIDKGIANFIQEGEEVCGVLEFEEFIEREAPFGVICQLKGTVVDEKITLEVTSFQISLSAESIEYFPESREGIINVNGQIVGVSEDEQGVCGVFVFEKLLD